MFLDEAELHDLTGRTYAKYQIAWLTANRWKFEVRSDGHPRVLRIYAEARMGAKPVKRRRPRLEGLAAA